MSTTDGSPGDSQSFPPGLSSPFSGGVGVFPGGKCGEASGRERWRELVRRDGGEELVGEVEGYYGTERK